MKIYKLLVVTDAVQARIFKINKDSLELLQELQNAEEISVDDAKRKTVSGLVSNGSVPGGAWAKRDNSVKETARKRFCEIIAKALKDHAVLLDTNLDSTKISLLADAKMLGELRKQLDDKIMDHVINELPIDVSGYPIQRLEEYVKSKGII